VKGKETNSGAHCIITIRDNVDDSSCNILCLILLSYMKDNE